MQKNKIVRKNINGVFLLDKPTGITSNRALQQVKYLFKAKKAGHTGNLDPLASGVLPICFGEATKFTRFLLDANKKYLVTAKLGLRTDTGDVDGEIVTQVAVPTLVLKQVEQVLSRFLGDIQQTPPMYSAIKYQGNPLYKLARQGIEVKRQPRIVTIYQIDLISLQADHLTLEVHCSKGTYIRTLIDDLGELLGCGAHVASLRRVSIGPYRIADTVTLRQLKILLADNSELTCKNVLLPIYAPAIGLPVVELPRDAAHCLMHGQFVAVPHAFKEASGWVRLNEEVTGRFLGVGEVLDDSKIVPRRLVNNCII